MTPLRTITPSSSPWESLKTRERDSVRTKAWNQLTSFAITQKDPYSVSLANLKAYSSEGQDGQHRLEYLLLQDLGIALGALEMARAAKYP